MRLPLKPIRVSFRIFTLFCILVVLCWYTCVMVLKGLDKVTLRRKFLKSVDYAYYNKLEDNAPASCSPTVHCGYNELNFQIRSGGGIEVTPSICVNNVTLIQESDRNYGRGMNVVLIDGRDGQYLKSFVFDVFSQTSNMFTNFLRSLEDEHIILITTYDEATKNLNAAARFELVSIGSQHSNDLHYRDNWAFVGGPLLTRQHFEKVRKNDVNINKYTEWPEEVVLKGCIPKVS